MTLTTVLIDISAVSVLLFLAFLIRQKIPFFYKYYIPTSLIAGILGLLLGPQVLGQFSPVHLQFSEWISQWTNFLFAFIFATSFLGTSTGKFGRDVLSTTCVTGVVFMAQVLVGLGIAFLLSTFMDNVPYAMGLLPVSGFYGGHGSAGIMGGCFATEGWEEAMGIALTYATIGMFVDHQLGSEKRIYQTENGQQLCGEKGYNRYSSCGAEKAGSDGNLQSVRDRSHGVPDDDRRYYHRGLPFSSGSDH